MSKSKLNKDRISAQEWKQKVEAVVQKLKTNIGDFFREAARTKNICKRELERAIYRFWTKGSVPKFIQEYLWEHALV